jgi:hypothetical protein
MIPPFNEFGYLPPGVYPATLDEIDSRFGQASEQRRAQVESVRWMVELSMRAGVQRIVLNSSFVTDIIEPGDVDRVLLIGRGFPKDRPAEAELRAGLPFLDIQIVRHPRFNKLVNVFFCNGPIQRTKGHGRGDSMTRGSYETLPNTIEKLRMLEAMVEEVQGEEINDEHLREVELESLLHLIAQLKDEIARYESHQSAR